jgi:hypothetical protein
MTNENLPSKIVINRLCIVDRICSKVFADLFVSINREDKCSDLKFRFGSFCNTFSSSLVSGVLRRIRKKFVLIHRVLLQPVEKMLSSRCCPRGAVDLGWQCDDILRQILKPLMKACGFVLEVWQQQCSSAWVPSLNVDVDADICDTSSAEVRI